MEPCSSLSYSIHIRLLRGNHNLKKNAEILIQSYSKGYFWLSSFLQKRKLLWKWQIPILKEVPTWQLLKLLYLTDLEIGGLSVKDTNAKAFCFLSFSVRASFIRWWKFFINFIRTFLFWKLPSKFDSEEVIAAVNQLKSTFLSNPNFLNALLLKSWSIVESAFVYFFWNILPYR